MACSTGDGLPTSQHVAYSPQAACCSLRAKIVDPSMKPEARRDCPSSMTSSWTPEALQSLKFLGKLLEFPDFPSTCMSRAFKLETVSAQSA
eukprot:CAMPEP_0194780734 /NCGR_PEP_ID=MMETSP0323_2-20130528/74373_1 /TAXON_ID=2866 ORGANISM="Crypthecodinium cohnii, Strain Seligo" /NCGR_SAMPLE_ID=MMETSP0323_2 /ASSEMBLY_ACC=CAM_ASM_000346 /LENGTH=90 /DNA_ID=CAMNT_0039718823 /DNA_START=138 /DNA_END=406 /DNA_ORIENTATION=-